LKNSYIIAIKIVLVWLFKIQIVKKQVNMFYIIWLFIS